MNARAATAGFTLVEVLAAMAVLAAVAAVAAPLLRGPPLAAQLRADTMRVAAMLRLTRASAMAQHRPLDVTVDRARSRIASMAGPAIDLDARIGVDAELGGMTALRFFPNGRATGGTIRLRAASLLSRISVIWATGDVRTEP